MNNYIEIILILVILLLTWNIWLNSYFMYLRLPIRIQRQLKKKRRSRMICIIDSLFSILVIPLSYIVPKKKNLILFMGRQNSGFLDNVKYLYIYLYEHHYNEKYDIIFVGHNDISLEQLNAVGFKTINYRPSIKVYGLLLRANLIITDNAHWTTHNRYNAALKAKKIQLWHGIGFKNIRLTDEKFRKAAHSIKGFFSHRLTGQLAIYDLFLSTSKFYTDKVFAPSFLPKEFFVCGYPRNDVFLQETPFLEEHKLINVDVPVYEKIKSLKQQGKKIILYTPTFRKARQYNISEEFLNFSMLSDFGESINAVFVFKLHPLPKYNIDFSLYNNVIEYNNRKDVYPLFKYADLLITDYSSIYMDYLLLDRPCLFFIYDFNYYIQSCRGVMHDIVDSAPGEKCKNQEELHNQLYQILVEHIDLWADQRKKVRDMAWEYQEGNSCQKAWDYISSKYLL